MDKRIIVAIDGYSSCGKSTIAKALAKAAGYKYVDTGAMYRCVALYVLRNAPFTMDNVDEAWLLAHINDIQISFALGADVGGHFVLPGQGLDVGLSLQNIGWQLKGFFTDENGDSRLEMLPLNLQLGLSYKLPQRSRHRHGGFSES